MKRRLQQLKLIPPVPLVSIPALRAQNAELDEEIALVLRRHASGPLDDEIEKTVTLVSLFAAKKECG